MSHFRRLILIAAILISCIGCDQATKAAARTYLAQGGHTSYLGDVFRLQFMENKGAFLGLGSALPEQVRFWLLIVITGFAMGGMLLFIIAHPSARRSLVVGISFIIGGGTGNLIDRIFSNGTVTDFMNAGIGSLRTGVFNVADAAIMTGMAILIGCQLRGSRKKQTAGTFHR